MIFPIGTVGERVRAPLITLALIVVNFAVFFAVQPRIAADERRVAPSSARLGESEFAIEMRHRGLAGTFASAAGLDRPGARRAFWRRYESGLVVRTDDPEYLEWRAAQRERSAALRGTLFHEMGFRRDEPRLVALFAHAFLHDGFWHVAFNMLFLWAAGAAMEDSWGRKWYALLYVFSLLAAALSAFVFIPGGEDMPVVGASGAVAGVMGALAARHFRAPMRVLSFLPAPGIYRVAAGWLLVPWVIMEVVAIFDARAADSGVAFGAHVVGFAAGAGLAGVLRFAGVEKGELETARAAERASRARAAALARADESLRAGRLEAAVQAMKEAVDATPEDLSLRARHVEMLGQMGPSAVLSAEAAELLQRQWRAGDRAAFLATWRLLTARGTDPPASLAHRAAVLLEPVSEQEAAETYARALREAPDDALAFQSLRKYAALLDRMGHAPQAAQVRAILARRERDRRDPGAS